MTDRAPLAKVRAAHGRLERIRAREQEARSGLRTAILDAQAAGHSYAAIGEVLGVSRQRIEQLSKER